MYENSGIYVDTDMEIIKDLTPILEEKIYMNFMKKIFGKNQFGQYQKFLLTFLRKDTI